MPSAVATTRPSLVHSICTTAVRELMAALGQRYQTMYHAARNGNWLLAAYQFRAIRKLFGTSKVTRPKYAQAMDEFAERYMAPISRAIEAKDWTAAMWADAYHAALDQQFPAGTRIVGDYGDPAGMQRNPSNGSSVIRDLNAAHVPVTPVAKRPQDFAIRILNNMMAGGRVFVNSEGAKRVSDAFSSHKWKLDKNGVRTGETPVHDWTSHLVDAVRYGPQCSCPSIPVTLTRRTTFVPTTRPSTDTCSRP